MALLFMDSFDHYATADITEKWTSISGASYAAISTSYGRNGTQGLRVGLTSTTLIGGTFFGGASTVIFGGAIRLVVGTPGTFSCMFGFGTATSIQVACMVMADATLGFYRATASHDIDTTSDWTQLGVTSVALQTNVWTYVEVKLVCNDTTGAITVRFNGTQVLALTGIDTSWNSTALTRFAMAGSGGGSAMRWDVDDLVLMDTNGSYNNDFLGDVTITAIYPSGAGATTGWTPSAGSNYDCCNEAQVNDDTDYVSTAVLTTKDTYAFTDAPAGADIRAVQLCIAARKGTEGPGQLTPVVRSSSTDYDQTAQGIGSTSYSYLRTVVETDPATAAAWSESGFNAAEFGFKKTG